ncbi:MAG: hypothetical protein PHW18_10815 [Sulfuricurvum sp.]|uniref:ABC transporter substrate-binding protein n=1 Tax=Sulfuricurvum sp. TaxID=2025608 RepID=UPI00260F494C|nr:hypothetical protein [Sulfuricurvum sp.]MDD2830054.1 hypothetical protein [Sulfuricurvum sp.]MDD4950638.1 hypothetical protein [Sulfuricurvum sp.]
MKILFYLCTCVFVLFAQSVEINENHKIKIAVMVAPSVIGRYANSTYNVALATSMARNYPFELIKYELADESEATIAKTITKIQHDSVDAILAPLTLGGVNNLLKIGSQKLIFIPTVHKRDVGSAPDNIIFGAIDYETQIEALLPYMANSLAIFYDDSPVGRNLSNRTQTIAMNAPKGSKTSTLYSVDTAGSNIVKYLGKPAAFSKRSVLTHLPVVKTSMLAAQLTFSGAREQNILSTQINFDPTLITLTQYHDRQNMIVANSIIEQVPQIYETNALMNNDLTFDWINYTTSVGMDYLIATLTSTPRGYTLRLIDSQVIYPVELMVPKEYGYEPKS